MRKTIRSAVAAAITMALCVPGAFSQDMAELEVDHALTFDFPTPHTDWAQPYALGKTRVLFFTDGRGTSPRECVELMQRFDIEAEAVFWARIVDSSTTHWHGGEVGERRMLNLLKQDWDCFVFLGLTMKNMSPEQQYKVLKPVAEGAGIVFVGADDPRVLKPENKLAEPPAFLAQGPVGDAFTVGSGRAMRLPGRPNIDYYEGWEVDYDYWSERLGRAVLWAAGKEPKANLQLRISHPELSAQGATGTLTVSYSGTPVGENPKLEMRLRRKADGWNAFIVTPGLAPGDTPITFANYKIPAGDYHIDARIRSTKGIEAWATVPFKVVSSRSVAEVKLYETWGEVGDSIAGAVTLAGAPLPDEALRVRLVDQRGRIIAEKTLAATNDPAEFDFTIEPWFPMLVTVRAEVLQAGNEVARGYQYAHVTKRHRGKFNFLIWDTPRGTLAPYAERSLAENSVTLQLGGGTPATICAANDIAWVPYTTRIMSKLNADGIMTPFCWNDEEAVKKHVEEKAQAYLGARQHGVFVWSLGDEVDTKGACLSPHCAEAYRRYLKEQYATVDGLNEEWGTDFADWTEVGLSKPDDSEEATAKNAGNYPRWFDRQAYKSWNFVQFCQKYAEAYAAIDPEAKTGFEGAGRFGQGDDLDLIIRSNQFWSPYPGTADEVIRSIAPRDFPRANWMGYTKDANSLLQKYWRMVTRGMDAVWFWRWDCIGRFHGWLAPDLRPFPAVKEILEDTQVLRDGLGDLLLKSEMLDDQVAILYSYPSTFAHALDQGGTYGGYEGAHLAAQTLVRDLGLQFRYVTDRMLRLGEFNQRKYRMLILPRASALGDEEAEVIRQFVMNGGTIVADVQPGIYDGHCKPRAQGVLDDLFGIERSAQEPATVATVELTDDPPVSFDKAQVDPSVTLTTGEAHGAAGETPVLITRQVGKGLAILWNFSMGSAPKLNISDTPEAIATQALAMFAGAGIEPTLTLESADGSRERNIEVIRWQNGGIEIMALFRENGIESEATVTLPEARFVYDLRNREILGDVKRFTTTIIPNRASFFVLGTKAAPEPRLQLETAGASPGDVVKRLARGRGECVHLRAGC